ncbi:MAG TPA: four helix bundle protein [Polyangiaceae bacterium]|nr:four helix bundle protein [Polyangiaceae bacterium]
MLRIYNVILSFIDDVASLVPRIAHHDPDLARQLRRAASSVALNVAEGFSARGRSRVACYNVALREMRESYTALEIAVRLRYLPPLGEKLEARCQHILATLYKLSFPRAAS